MKKRVEWAEFFLNNNWGDLWKSLLGSEWESIEKSTWWDENMSRYDLFSLSSSLSLAEIKWIINLNLSG